MLTRCTGRWRCHRLRHVTGFRSAHSVSGLLTHATATAQPCSLNTTRADTSPHKRRTRCSGHHNISRDRLSMQADEHQPRDTTRDERRTPSASRHITSLMSKSEICGGSVVPPPAAVEMKPHGHAISVSADFRDAVTAPFPPETAHRDFAGSRSFRRNRPSQAADER